jgi:hypothetical protein
MRLPQFKLAGILWAIFWLSLSFAAWRIEPPTWILDGLREPWAHFLLNGFRIALIPTAIGALFGYTFRGFLIGVALYIGLMALLLFLWAHFGDL